MTDFFGLQDGLVRAGHRVCLYDQIGMGWSSYQLVQQPPYFEEMFRGSGTHAAPLHTLT